MESLYNELRIQIFKYVSTPISLILTNRKWYTISRDRHARAKWMIHKYGRSHALFHSVRLENFITLDVLQALIARDVIISRYFIQRLLMQFGTHDNELIKIKVEYNNQNHTCQKSSWASNLPLEIFIKLITEAYNVFYDHKLAVKGNDMELFHFLSGGPLAINRAPQKLSQNINDIEDLILNKKFIPFPPRPKLTNENTIERDHEEYPPKDGYENNRQLNVIARAIIIRPDLVKKWKNIGYYEICDDVNELVIQGALLILFPPTPPNDWECPNVNNVVDNLKKFTDLGFQLTNTVMRDLFKLYENRLSEIGDILMSSFQVLRKESRSVIAGSCLSNISNPERNPDLSKFLNAMTL